MAAKKGLGELLVSQNIIGMDQLEEARRQQKSHGGRLTSALVNLGYVKERDLATFLGQQYDLPTIDLMNFEVDPEATKLLTRQICEKHLVIPVSKAAKSLVVAFADPSNIYVKDDLALLTRCKIEVVVASEASIQYAIDRCYGGVNKMDGIMSEIEDEADADGGVSQQQAASIEADASGSDAPIIKFVNTMLSDAIKRNASDIHIEPYEKRFRVRFRIDGNLRETLQPPAGAAAAIISRIKIMCKMDIAERRRPQDGRLKVKLRNQREVDFRVNSLPTLWGEKIVMRILDKSNLQVDMTKLGFLQPQLDTFKKAIALPQGMILVTGPTGSGKTTTLYSALQELNDLTSNVSTAEDPVEFNLEGINQVQINTEIDFTFAAALKAFLRQDPDVIMVGEIRDLDTANVAYKAASTGHLVLSTLHTNDSASTVARLLDMGVPNFMVAESTTLVTAQRLIKKICRHCIVDHRISNEELLAIGVPKERLHEFQTCFKGEGCSHCNDTGLAGRVAIHEVMEINSTIKEGIFRGDSPLQLKRRAIESGMFTLRTSALEKMREGVTSLQEVINSTVGDDV